MGMTGKQIERMNRHALESMMTAEQALAWAFSHYEDTGCWPTRRFRVEGSKVGRSRLLGRAAADRTQEKYGGKVVEIVPAKKYAKLPERKVAP